MTDHIGRGVLQEPIDEKEKNYSGRIRKISAKLANRESKTHNIVSKEGDSERTRHWRGKLAEGNSKNRLVTYQAGESNKEICM